jgi:hypothetical protein
MPPYNSRAPRLARVALPACLLLSAPAPATNLTLNDAGSVWLTLGGEYRLKFEGLHDPSFGVQKNKGYTATGERFFGQADLHTLQGPRLFIELAAATDTGRQPTEPPFYRSAPQIAQGFIELPFSLREAHFKLRLGRQELDFDGNRLVSSRDVTNLRRAFDLALASATWGAGTVQTFVGHPVRNRHDAFEDDATPAEKFWGARARYASPQSPQSAEAFYFVRTRFTANYQGAVGPEQRRTLGLRSSGNQQGFDYALQAAIQRGTVARRDIRAYGAAADLGLTLSGTWRPRLGLSSGFASGGKAGPDGAVRTFDALYPNLSYFTDAPLIYPGNDWDIQPNLTLHPLSAVTLRAGVDVLRRVSRQDAVYEQPGFPLICGTGTGSDAIAELSYLKADWKVNRYLDLNASYVRARAGTLVVASGGHDTNYFTVQADVKL